MDVIEQTPTAKAESFEAHRALRLAQTEPATEPKEPLTPKEVSEPDKGESAAASEAGKQEIQEKDDKPKRDRSFDGRISELTAARRQAEEEAARLREELRTYRTRKPEPEPSKPAVIEPKPAITEDDPKPKLKDFAEKAKPGDSYEDVQERWEEAVSDWRDRKRQGEQRKADEAKQRESTATRLRSQMVEARGRHEDFDAVTAGDAATGTGLVLSPDMLRFIAESDEGMEVAYHLGKNPEEYRRIFGLSPTRQIAELGKIEDKLASGVQKAPPEEKKPVPVSKAPKPPTQLGGTEAPAGKSTAEANSMEEHRRIREAAMRR